MLASVEWNVYPNPVKDKLFVELKENSAVKIVDAFGKIVQVHNLTQGINTLSVATLPEGFYFIQTSSGRAMKFIKL